MKKIFLAVAALAMLATSCTKDDATSGSTESLVSFTVDSPELQTRYGEGVSTNRLVYAFYDEAGNHLQELDGKVENYKTKATIKVYLVEGRKYQAIFWADNTEADYAVNFATKTMTINNTTLDGNSEDYDAFYNYTLDIDPADKTHRIELRRPFAQINIATKDTAAAKAAGVEVQSTKVSVSAYKTLTFGTEVDSTTGEVVAVANVSNKDTFTYDWAPKAEGKAMTDYDMLSMNYVLVNARELVDVTLRMSEDAAQSADNDATDLVRHYTTVPVQRNYRTYIVGNLLTTNNEFIIETNPEWEKPNIELSVWDGSVDTTWYNDTDTEFTLTDSQDLAGLAKLVDEGNTFEGKTVKLNIDMNLYKINENGEPICFEPIGSYRFDKAFKGTFDGQGHSISNLNQNTWTLDNGYYYNDCGIGLFGKVKDATIKNLKIDNASISGESGLCGVVAAVAYGDMTFENITVTNSKCNDYQYYAGGIVGWASGNHTYKNCNIDASNVVGGQWGDFGNQNGGVIGGISGSAQILMEDCNVACVIDAVNDVVSAYRYYAYRCCGMLIGNTNQKQEIDGTPYAAAPQLTCKNVTVTYGDWMNYTYCEFAGTGFPYVRVQAGVSVDAYSNIRYGHPTDANGNTVVDDNHVHNDGEDHHLCLPFDQLLGGGPNGDGRNPVYGLASFPGVTVNYPASYTQE